MLVIISGQIQTSHDQVQRRRAIKCEGISGLSPMGGRSTRSSSAKVGQVFANIPRALAPLVEAPAVSSLDLLAGLEERLLAGDTWLASEELGLRSAASSELIGTLGRELVQQLHSLPNSLLGLFDLLRPKVGLGVVLNAE